MNSEREKFWDQVYSTRLAEKVGWYRPRLDTPMEWLHGLGLDSSASIIDIGGGASTLVDDLIDEGFESVTILDVAKSALEVSKKRLGRQADLVMWLSGDVTEYALPPARFDVWHDRAMFHFLVEDADREAYRANLLAALKPGGYLLLGVFAPEAPPKCSGLPVRRSDQESLSAFLGDDFELLQHRKEVHITPGGVEQMYLYCLFRRSE